MITGGCATLLTHCILIVFFNAEKGYSICHVKQALCSKRSLNTICARRDPEEAEKEAEAIEDGKALDAPAADFGGVPAYGGDMGATAGGADWNAQGGATDWGGPGAQDWGATDASASWGDQTAGAYQTPH